MWRREGSRESGETFEIGGGGGGLGYVKNVELPILYKEALLLKFFKEALLLKSSKLGGLEDTAGGETNVVQRYHPQLFTSYAFLEDFTVDLAAISRWAQ
jgi:hypothetical protein